MRPAATGTGAPSVTGRADRHFHRRCRPDPWEIPADSRTGRQESPGHRTGTPV